MREACRVSYGINSNDYLILCITTLSTAISITIIIIFAIFMIIMRSLHDLHEMNARRAGHVCVSARLIQLKKNRWTDLDEIWYGRYAIGDYREIVLLNILHKVKPTWRTNKLVR
jgi:hypothetical protein